MSSRQLNHLQDWHIPVEAMKDYMKRHRADPEVYVDFTTYYRANELRNATPAYGGLLNGPSWSRFVQWWHKTKRTYTKKSAEEQESLKY